MGGLAGQVSTLIDEIKPAPEALEEMVKQAADIIAAKIPQNVTVA